MRDRLSAFLILAALCAAVYANILGNAFVSDDVAVITEAASPAPAARLLFAPADLLNRLDYRLSGQAPLAYRLTSVCLHAAVTFLVYLFLRTLFSHAPSLLGAALFAVHPINTEAVNLVAARPYIINAFFSLIIYLLYERATRTPGILRNKNSLLYLASLSLFAFAATGNPYFFLVLPLFIIWSDISLGRIKRTWALWLPFMLLVGARVAATFAYGEVAVRAAHMEGAPVIRDTTYLVYSSWRHLLLLVWPNRLSLFHWGIDIPVFILRYNLIICLAIAGVLLLAFRRARPLFLAAGIFFIFLLPTFSPFPISSLVAERYLYLASLALSTAVAFLYTQNVRSPAGKTIVLALVAAALCGLSLRTVGRNQEWKDAESFWKRETIVSPDNWEAHNNLAYAYLQKSKLREAQEEYEKVTRLNPGSAEAYNNLGVIFLRTARQEAAIGFFRKALEQDATHAPAYFNLAVASYEKGDYANALEYCDQAVRLGLEVPGEFLRLLEPWRKK